MSRSFLVICQLAQKLRVIQITQNLKGKIVNHFLCFLLDETVHARCSFSFNLLGENMTLSKVAGVQKGPDGKSQASWGSSYAMYAHLWGVYYCARETFFSIFSIFYWSNHRQLMVARMAIGDKLLFLTSFSTNLQFLRRKVWHIFSFTISDLKTFRTHSNTRWSRILSKWRWKLP